jgi:hypothetical protein
VQCSKELGVRGDAVFPPLHSWRLASLITTSRYARGGARNALLCCEFFWNSVLHVQFPMEYIFEELWFCLFSFQYNLFELQFFYLSVFLADLTDEMWWAFFNACLVYTISINPCILSTIWWDVMSVCFCSNLKACTTR